MQTYRIWEGTRTFLPGEDTSKYTIFEILAEDIGWFIELPDEGLLGKTYNVYRTESGEIIIHTVQESGIGEPHIGSVHRYRNLEEAAVDFEQALKDMRLI